MKNVILPFITVLSFLACSEPECFELTPEQKEWLPYDEGDTIKFVSSDSIDSITYIVSEHIINQIFTRSSRTKRSKDICITESYFDLRRVSTNVDQFDSPPGIFGNGFNYTSDYYVNLDDDGGYNRTSTYLYSNLEQQDLELISGKTYTANIVYNDNNKERGRSIYYAAYNKEKGIIAFKVANRPDIRFELLE